MSTFDRLKNGLESDMLAIIVDPTNITETARLREDLGLDSLDEVSIELWIEEEYGIEVPDGASDDWLLVSDIVQFIDRATAHRQVA